jgi:hypothetical protein
MRRTAALIVVVLVFVWIVGCSHFINQTQSEFFSVEKGPNRDAFEVPVEKDAPNKTPELK